MNFLSLYGHETIKTTLGHMIKSDRISNAYVFQGAEGVGKKFCARIFAKALVCQNSDAPCGKCPMCIQADARTLPDIITVEKDKDKTQISVDNVREQVIAEAYIKPGYARRKIFIIEKGDELNTEAQNALLKVLEEPPSYVTFIICVTNKEKLLQTVLSRSQVVSFFPLPTEVVEKYLLDKNYDAKDIKTVAKLARGSIGTAVALLEDESKRACVEKSVDLFLNLKKGALSLREMTAFLSEEKENAEEIIDYIMAFLRDCVLKKTGMEENVIFSDKIPEMTSFLENMTKKKLVSAFDKLSELKLSLKQNLNFNTTVAEAMMRVWEELHD